MTIGPQAGERLAGGPRDGSQADRVTIGPQAGERLAGGPRDGSQAGGEFFSDFV